MVEGGAVLQGQLLQRNLAQAYIFWVLYRMLSRHLQVLKQMDRVSGMSN